MSCVFCGIVAGDVPAARVFTDDLVTAFMDINPASEGHLLVVPRVHCRRLGDAEPAVFERMTAVAQRLVAALYASSLECADANLLLSDGAVAGQEVEHVHLHVIPRRPEDGVVITAAFQRTSMAALAEVAETIASVLS